MQIIIKWTCRQCGEDAEVTTDSAADYGVMQPEFPDDVIEDDDDIDSLLVRSIHLKDLRCLCGHVSAQLGLAYQYLEVHRPTWEQENQEADLTIGRSDGS